MREPRGASEGATEALGSLSIMTHLAGDRVIGELDLEWAVTATAATGGFFQRHEPLGNLALAADVNRLQGTGLCRRRAVTEAGTRAGGRPPQW
jgi:hypothetical protein